MVELTDAEIGTLIWLRDHMSAGGVYEPSAIWTDVWLALRPYGISDEWTCRQVLQGLNDLGLIAVHWGEGETQHMLFGRITRNGIEALRERDAKEAEQRRAGSNPHLVFLSSHHSDGRLAAQLQVALERFGLSCFVAHRDIEVSAEWRQSILDNLRNCDCCLALVTEGFRGSEWCNQECGFVIARGKPIFSVMIDAQPLHGLVEMYQGIRWDGSDLPKSIREVVGGVLRGLNVPTASLVKGFTASETAEDASFAVREILGRDDVSAEQVNLVARAYYAHPRWREGPAPLGGIEEFFRRYHALVEPKLWNEIEHLPLHGSRSVPV